jgi:hypothetical protein
MATPLEEDKVSLDALNNILKSASMDSQISKDEVAVRVEPSYPRATSITLDKQNRCLKFLMAAGPMRGKDEEKDRFINRLNLKEFVSSFYWSPDDDDGEGPWVTAKYFFSIAGGMVDEQFISTVRRFASDFTDGITRYDTDQLIYDPDAE